MKIYFILLFNVAAAENYFDIPMKTDVSYSSFKLGTNRTKEFIWFSGEYWAVKHGLKEPGPNTFSDENVFMDSEGNLHLKLQKEGENWKAAGVYNLYGLTYGTYTWNVKSDVSNLNENVVLSLFAWDIDIEIAKWKVKDMNTNSQFVVQPSQTQGNLQRFNQNIHGASIWKFTWTQSKIAFSISDGSRVVYQWDYLGKSIPPPSDMGGSQINLWMVDNTPPSDGNPVEVVIQRYSFEKA